MKRIMLMIIFMITVFGFVFYFAIYPTLKNEDTITVPDVIGSSEEDALDILNKSGINYEIIYQKGEEKGVLKTIPEANSLIKQSQKVIVYISMYEEKRIDDLTGYSYEDAIHKLEEYKDEFGITYNVTYKSLDSGIDNIVIEQSDKSSYLKDIKEINITVSKVDNTILMPNFIGQNYQAALDFCTEYGFEVEAIYVSSLLNRNKIIYQEIEPNTVLYKNTGTRLTIYVAK